MDLTIVWLGFVKVEHLKGIYEINEFNGIFLQRVLNLLRELDTSRIFHEPVDAISVPTYYETITQPMDFSRMQQKLNGMEYKSVAEMEADFSLMIQNCMQFNQKKGYYHNLALKIREQVRRQVVFGLGFGYVFNCETVVLF